MNMLFVVSILTWIYRFFYWALIGRCVLSFMQADYDSPITKIYQFLVKVTEVICVPCRELLYRLGVRTGPFDFSVLIAFFLLRIVYRILVGIVMGSWAPIGLL